MSEDTGNWIIGDFEVFRDQLLGKGAWGEVYKGRQVSLNRPVAIKILKKEMTQDAEFVRRFRREAETIAKLIDENIIQVFGAGEHDGSHFFAMEMVQGVPLQKFFDKGHKFTTDEIIYVAIAVSKALRSAWESPAQIVHRDIKPSNIMISYSSSLISAKQGGGDVTESGAFIDIDIKEARVKVMDFGLAKVVVADQKDATLVGTVIGTPKYISPEQGLGNPADIRSDIYSLGIVMYEMSTGRLPFASDNAISLIRSHIYDQALPPSQFNPDVPKNLESVIMNCIQKDPNHRYGNPVELLTDLEAVKRDQTPLYAQQTIANLGATMLARPGGVQPKSKVLLIGGIAVAVLLIAAVGFLFFQKPPKPQYSPPPVSSFPANQANTPIFESINKDEDPVIQVEKLVRQADQLINQEQFEQAGLALANAYSITSENKTVNDLRAKLDQVRNERTEQVQQEQITKEYNEYLNKGIDEKVKKNWDGALEFFKKAMSKKNSTEVQGYMEEITRIQDKQRQYDDIVKQAEELENQKEYDEAIKLYEQSKPYTDNQDELKKKISHCTDKLYDAWYEKGSGLIHEGKYASADNALKQALKYKPGTKDALDKITEIKSLFPPNMVFVEAGDFMMGQEGKKVNVKSFFIDTYEVTNQEYKKFLEAVKEKGHLNCHPDEKTNPKLKNKNHTPEFWVKGEFPPAEANYPVVGVDWYDAYAYAAWSGKKLPTEAEWEKAARGTDGRIFAGGWADGTQVKANVKGVGNGAVSNVGAYKDDVSPYGVADMTGNVSEWVFEWWSDKKSEEKVVIRGGDWYSSVIKAKAFYRNNQLYFERTKYVGFRCVKSIK